MNVKLTVFLVALEIIIFTVHLDSNFPDCQPLLLPLLNESIS